MYRLYDYIVARYVRRYYSCMVLCNTESVSVNDDVRHDYFSVLYIMYYIYMLTLLNQN